MKIPYAPYRFQIFLVCSSTVVSIYNHLLHQIIWKNQRHFGIHLLKKFCVLIIFFAFTYSVLIIYGSSFEYPQIHLLLFAYLLQADWSLCLSELLTSRINSLPTSAPNLQSTSSFFSQTTLHHEYYSCLFLNSIHFFHKFFHIKDLIFNFRNLRIIIFCPY